MAGDFFRRKLQSLQRVWSDWRSGSEGVRNVFARHRVLRPIALVTLVVFTSTTLPIQAAVRLAAMSTPAAASASASDTPACCTASTPEERYGQLLDAVKDQSGRAKSKRGGGREARDEITAIRNDRAELDSLEADIEARFADVSANLAASNAPQTIRDRHNAAVDDYRARLGQFKQLARRLDDADDRNSDSDRDSAIDALLAFFDQYPQGKRHQPLDPAKLPFRTANGQIREPATDAREFPAGMFPDDQRRTALSVSSDAPAAATRESSAMASIAAAPPPGAADLAATDDVQITPRIRDLAASLNNNPVQIYRWVREHIEFLPTYGSIQGSDLTLINARGNAFDTASLLIALYRAAGIPSRYVYGTVEIPIDKALNWVGGVNTPAMAQDLLGQGGVPTVAIVSGGRVVALRIEHVWVEAYVDYTPSRGAINRTPSAWVPMDASFKQYTYTQGLDVFGNVPFDVPGFVAQAQQGATVDPAGGYVQNLNLTNAKAQLTNYSGQALSYINGARPNAVAEDLLGRKTVIAEPHSILLGSLPYKTVAVGQRMSTLPASLRHSVDLKFYASIFDRAFDSPGLTYSVSLPKLGAGRLGVTYAPATAADAQVIASIKQQGSTTLPVYLIRVIPLVQIDGQTVATGAPVTMGQQVYWSTTLADPQNRATDTLLFSNSAGDEIVFGIDGAGVTQNAIQQRSDAVDSDTASENLFRIALQFWYEYDLFDAYLASRKQGATARLPSIGAFSAPLVVSYFFGVPRSATYRGRSMDVQRVLSALTAETSERVASLRYASGIVGSHLEGAIFEQILAKPDGASVSAVQLLRDAAAQGIRIYRLTSQNAASLNDISATADVKSDISAALSAGKFVLVPERSPVHNRWSGTGYIVADPATGAGAYLLNGGMNGGADPNCDDNNEPPRQPIWIYVLGFLFFVLLMWMIIAAILGSGGTLAPAGAAAALFFMAFFLSPQEAYAGGFNRNQCCENAKSTAGSAAPSLDTRLAEWAANVGGLRNRGHWDAIAQETRRLGDALGQISKYCRTIPPALESWSETYGRGQAFLATVPRPPA